MAHHVEPMDIDSDFDNKENSLHHNNVLPFTEKGYEELDVSELNMKLRYSVTPASSPMSKSYTATCPENRSLQSGDESLNVTVNENVNLSRSLNSTLTKNDNTVKSLKALPLQSISTEQFGDCNRNTSVLRPIESATTPDNANITVTVSGASDIDENLSMPSSSSSALQTPESTTPTKDIAIKDGGSPIMRGLKSVLNMFRPSQSPIPPTDSDNVVKSDILSPTEESTSISTPEAKSQLVLASTPISSHRKKEMSPTKRSTPPKDSSIVFNDDLEKELQWKDETTIIFSQSERIPIHKLMLQQSQDNKKMMYKEVTELPKEDIQDLNSTVEYMDISYNDSIKDKTITELHVANKKSDDTIATESDGEFVDCETTFTQNMSHVNDDNDKTPVADQTLGLNITDQTEDINLTEYIQNNDSGSRLKPIILDTTQDILDATLSVRPEDLLPHGFNQTKDVSASLFNKTETIHTVSTSEVSTETHEQSSILEVIQSRFNETVDISNPLTLESQTDNPNVTKTIEIMSTTQPANQTFDVISSLRNEEHDKDDLDGTLTIQNDSVPLTEIQPNICEDFSAAVSNATFIQDNTFVTEVTSTSDIVVAKVTTESVPAIEPQIYEPIDSAINVTIPIAFDPFCLEETISKPLPEANVKDVSMTELPIDIPLPDEDDLEKELNIPVDTTPDVTPPVSLPIDLVDDLKMITEANNIIDNKTNKLEFTEMGETDQKNILNINVDKDISDKANISDNIDLLPEMLAPSKVIDTETVLDSKINCNDEINLPITENASKAENIEQCNNTFNLNVIEKQEVVSMDINESVCEFKPLPDIINQTITMSNVESLELNADVQVSIEPTQQIESIIPEVANNDIKDVKPKIINANDLKQVEETINVAAIIVTEIPVTADAVVGKESSNEPCTDDNIKTLENVVEAIENIKIDAIHKENTPPVTDIKSLDVEVIYDSVKTSQVNEIEEEIIASENNSPFVSVTTDNIPDVKLQEETIIQNLDDPCASKTKVVVTPPSSPPISSKGYNFNFDDMDFDPFATKTKIRVSPPSDSPNKSIETMAQVATIEKPFPKKEFNRRRAQTERKKPNASKRKLNSTFDAKLNDKLKEKPVDKTETGENEDNQLDSPATIALEQTNVTVEENKLDEPIDITRKETIEPQETLNSETAIELDNKIEQQVSIETSENNEVILESSNSLLELKAKSSSSDQSTHYSTCTSCSETSLPSKNVFNLPEIDDINFNPFATKSKMCQSPPPSLDNPFATKSKIMTSPDTSMIISDNKESKSFEDKIETESMEKDVSGNLNNATVLLKSTDEVNTSGSTRDIHTEDEDTVEGPFLDTEDLNPDDKIVDFENDMMQFNELPAQSNEDNLDTGEMFIDAEAFEFLLNQNKSNTVIDSGKESLFLKFDPLFAKRMSAVSSDSVVASLAKLQKRQSTPTKATRTPPNNMPSPIAGPSNLNVTQDMDVSEEYNDDLNITVSKPMMVVPPAVNPVTPRNKSLTPNRSNRRSITFTSPAMAVIDRLLSLSGNNSLVHDTTVTQVSREQNEADIALSQLRELLAEKEINVYNLRSESNDLRDRLSTLEGHVKNLEAEGEDRLKKINQLNDTLTEKTKINKSMAAVVEEYERTIASLIAETAQDKKRHAEERMKLINERDEQTAHLASMEVSFSDLHSKYEKSKQIILNCKANEEKYKKSIKEFEENLTKMQNNYELLKQHATSKLNHANQELEKMNRSHEAEVLKLNAMIKRKELHITSLEESLTQKTKANEELTAICDELINKVG